jgi:putative Mg2+ transporter-C (MgtC) family protein
MSELMSYWSRPELFSNGVLILNVLGAAALGIVMGYERSFHGHAAGMRTYGLVCMASAGLTVICGYPHDWYGAQIAPQTLANVDPTKVIQGIVTGIGFLGAGVIMKEGFTIRGLSTAASIWVTSVIGVIIGVGFYATAILTTILVLIVMGSFKRLEMSLPHRRQMRLGLTYPQDKVRAAEDLPHMMKKLGFSILELSCQSDRSGKQFEYDLVLQGDGTHNFNELIDLLRDREELLEFRLSPVRD